MPLFSPFLVAFFLTLGLGVLVLFVLPGRQRIILSELPVKETLITKARSALYAAGIFDRAPNLLFLALASLSVLVGVLFAIVLGGILAFPLGPIVVFFVTYSYLRGQQRRFQIRASEELVPFLNRVATGVLAGQPAQEAYLNAVEEAQVLKDVLQDSASKIASGERFSYALLETLPRLPLRMWAVFVRQLELYEEVGGDVGTAIERSVAQVNTMMQLQAEARADYAIQSWQQRIIIGVVAGGTFIWAASSPERFLQAFTTPIGILGLIFGVTLLVFGIWFLNKQLLDVEGKISF